MKTIYLENTLNILSQIEGIDIVNSLVQMGKVKETEDKVKYLLIEE